MAQFTITFAAEYVPRVQAAFARPSNTIPPVMTPATVDQVKQDTMNFIINTVLEHERAHEARTAASDVDPIVVT